MRNGEASRKRRVHMGRVRARTLSPVLALALSAIGMTGAPALGESEPAGDVQGLIEVGGHRLFIRCTGEGSPTVVLDAAARVTSETWNQVQPGVASSTRVCSYDRAGLGQSDPGPVPRTSHTMVEELRTLLRNASVEGPYVLVGHSLGGLNMHLFARLHPDEVVGVVLVDATPAEILDRFGEVLTPEQLQMVFPGPARFAEGVDFRASLAQVKAAPAFPNVPLVVLARTIFPPGPPGFPNEELNRRWDEMQAAQAGLSSSSQLIFVEGAGHFIHLERPEVVIEAILRVVEQARALTRSGRGCGDKNHFHERRMECTALPPAGQGLAP